MVNKLLFMDYVRRRARAGRFLKESQHNTEKENMIIRVVNAQVRDENMFRRQYERDNGGTNVKDRRGEGNSSDVSGV